MDISSRRDCFCWHQINWWLSICNRMEYYLDMGRRKADYWRLESHSNLIARLLKIVLFATNIQGQQKYWCFRVRKKENNMKRYIQIWVEVIQKIIWLQWHNKNNNNQQVIHNQLITWRRINQLLLKDVNKYFQIGEEGKDLIQ